MSEVWLAHHGILGQKWGVRRYQNKDGSLTGAGKKRYGIDGVKKDGYQKHDKLSGTITDGYQKHQRPVNAKYKNDNDDTSDTRREMSDKTKKALKTAVIVGATAVAAGLVAYGAYKGGEYLKTEAGRRIINEGKKQTDVFILESRMFRNRAISEFNAAKDYDRRIFANKNDSSLLPKEAAEKQRSQTEKIYTEYRDNARERGKLASNLADAYDSRVRQIKNETRTRANKVSGSVVESAKYLLDERKKKKRS